MYAVLEFLQLWIIIQLIRSIPPEAHRYPQHSLKQIKPIFWSLYLSLRLPPRDTTLSTYQAKVTEKPFRTVACCRSLKLIRAAFKCYTYQTHIINAGQSSHNALFPSPLPLIYKRPRLTIVIRYDVLSLGCCHGDSSPLLLVIKAQTSTGI